MSIAGRLRYEARECVARAKAKLAMNEPAATRYACLELRQAIEYLAYQQLEAYLAEVPDDAMRKWTPREVISQMLEVDPLADQSFTVSVKPEDVPGQPPRKMTTLGEVRRFTLKWANRSHNALGNFLHAPTLHQFETNDVPTHETMRNKANDIAADIEHTLATTIYNANFGVFYEIDCKCGRRFKRREGSFVMEQGIVCPNPECRMIWDVVSEEGTRSIVRPRQTGYPCHRCKETNFVYAHHVKPGQVFRCECGGQVRVALRLVPIDDPAPN